MRRKQKRKPTSSATDVAASCDDQPKTPKIVEDINESDDEEIPEDEAFNSEDERLFGHFFVGGSNDGDDEISASGDEISSEEDTDDDHDESDDGGQYMLDLLNKLDGSNNDNKNAESKSDLSLAQMVRIPESEYSNSISKKGLTLDNLMEGIEDTQGFQDLQKNLRSKPATTSAPLDKKSSSRVQRKIAYKVRSKDISRWVDIIQQNRQSESLDFKPKERLQMSRDVLVEKFQPKTNFEKEVEEALEEAGQQDEEAVLKKEEEALQDDLGANRLTMEEYKKRRGQLAQIRALMFYHERKRHQMKKIKSKKYRRIRKKQRDRLKESAIESAIEQDQDLAKELKEKEEVARIQERMTLAHKNTSKWAKRILKRGKNVDVDTRRALSAQIKRGDDLRRKMIGSDDEDSDGNADDENLIESARRVLQETEDDSDPAHGKTGLFKLSFMQKGIQKQREKAREEARKLLGELEGNEIDYYDDMVQSEEYSNSSDKWGESTVLARNKSDVLEKGELVARSLEFGNSNSIAMNSGIEINLHTSFKSAGEFNNDEEDSSHFESASTKHKIDPSTLTNNESSECETLMKFDKTLKEKTIENRTISSKTRKNQSHSGGGTHKDIIQATKRVLVHDGDDSNPWMKSTMSKGSTTMISQKVKQKSVVDVEAAIDILSADTDGDESAKHFVEDGSSGKNEEKKITSLTQEELVRRAFVGQNKSDIEEEFKKEKEDMVLEEGRTRHRENRNNISDEVLGWGSWTGQGAPTPKPRKLPKKLQAPKRKKDDKRRRSDDYKPDVIINQKRLKKTANSFMLADVPHPYASRAEYENAMLGGVGKEWNVSGSFKNMTRPEILTRSGKIIKPISKRAKQPRAAAKF